MSTIIESINKITEIKRDLNDILRENGLEGGDVFSDYPDKFRELFRVITSMIDSSTSGYTPDETNVTTVVPAPSLRQYQNVVYVTNNMDEATIYYYVNTDSGNHDIGLTRLEKGNSIVVSEPSTVYVYAQYRAEKSSTVSIYVPWNPEVVPDPPVIVRNGTTVTMTCNVGDEIYYATGSVGMSEWQLYTGPITVERYENIWALAQNWRGRSDTIFDEAPEPLPLPDTPIIQCNLNVVEITCGTEGATIYYKKQTDKYFIEYTGPFTITQSDYYEAKAMKDGLYGGEAIEYCRYVEEPTAPVISCADNAVSITCEPAAETIIYYKINDGEWQEYNGPILLTETVTITAYGNHYGVIGPSTTQECVYVAPIDVDEPEFSQIVNTVSITCDTEGADIWYRIDNADVWSLYEGPIDIDRDMQIQAYATVGNAISDTVTYNAEYIDAEADAPAAPVGSCSNNVVTITCETPNADIYYRDINDGYWTKYEGEFLITESHTYVIYATKYGLVTYGTPFDAIYDESSTLPTAPNPAITYNPANHTVTITCSNPQATIYYSLDSGNWDEYRGPFEITADGYVYAYSKITGWQNSSIVMKYCRLEGDEPVTETVATPVIAFTDPVVTITCATSGAAIYYSYDNSTWNRYAGNIILLESKTIYAKATKAGWNDSVVASRYCEIGAGTDHSTEYFGIKLNGTANGAALIVNTGVSNGYGQSPMYYRIGNGAWTEMNYINIDDGSDTDFRFWVSLDNVSANTTISLKRTNPSDVLNQNWNIHYGHLSGEPSDTPLKIRLRIIDGTYVNSTSSEANTDIVNYDISGNILSMQLGDSFASWSGTIVHDWSYLVYSGLSFRGTFGNGLHDARDLYLPTGLSNNCFVSLFKGCTGLVSAPKLPVSSGVLPIGCYQSMFYGCTSLINPPDLPAQYIDTGYRSEYDSGSISAGSYDNLFYGCTSLSRLKINMIYAVAYVNGNPVYYTGNESEDRTIIDQYNRETVEGAPEMAHACRNMLTNTAASGTITVDENAVGNWTRTVVGIVPSGWTVQTVTA